mmetsp:Transcript_28888/g.73329  ORF Transcript_28888/g.73329 Transcript_28888/m.73329 type:complete len:269 (+) Transcript_28888:726-1532(+)
MLCSTRPKAGARSKPSRSCKSTKACKMSLCLQSKAPTTLRSSARLRSWIIRAASPAASAPTHSLCFRHHSSGSLLKVWAHSLWFFPSCSRSAQDEAHGPGCMLVAPASRRPATMLLVMPTSTSSAPLLSAAWLAAQPRASRAGPRTSGLRASQSYSANVSLNRRVLPKTWAKLSTPHCLVGVHAFLHRNTLLSKETTSGICGRSWPRSAATSSTMPDSARVPGRPAAEAEARRRTAPTKRTTAGAARLPAMLTSELYNWSGNVRNRQT